MMKSAIPVPPVYPDGVLASTVLQHVDIAISLTWEALLANNRGEFLQGTPIQMRSIFDRLATIRREILAASIPEPRYRMANSRGWIFQDAWDHDCMYGQFIEAVMFIYEHGVLPEEIPPSYRNASVDSILADRERLRLEEAAKPEALPAQDPEARVMPHHPDPKSMRTYLQAADMAIGREGPTDLITSGTKKFIVGQQYLIRSLISYWLQHQTGPILKEFRFGVALNWEGIVAGYPAHIWDVQQLFWDSVVARNERVAAALIDRAEDAWNLAQTRPVPWLTARLRCMFTLHRQSKVAIGAYFEDFRLAAFVDKLPPELEKDVPLIHNSYRILVAVRDQAWTTLEERLAERMDLLIKHFWRQVTPAGLVDTFGLSVARWARDRGYRVQLQHVYLPLDWLDVPVDAKPAG